MDTNKRELLLLKDEVFQIVGCAIEIINTLGHGLLEKPMKMRWWWSSAREKSLFGQQRSFDVLYKGHKVGVFVPDLVAFDSVVVGYQGDRANH